MLKTKAIDFTQAFSDADKLADVASRRRKAEKIRAVLAQEEALPRAGMTVLDIGCSHGLILQRLVADGGLGIGIDLDQAAFSQTAANLAYARTDAERLPFPAHHFDVVICNHVYEHTDDPARLMAEVARVLKPTGICYFAGPNRYALIEPHYGVPLLSWLPQTLADVAIRRLGLAESYAIHPYSRSALRRLLANFAVTDYAAAIVNDPVHYWVDDILPPGSRKQQIARLVLRLCPWVFPDFVLVLRPNTAE